jgi:hypothetical protein
VRSGMKPSLSAPDDASTNKGMCSGADRPALVRRVEHHRLAAELGTPKGGRPTETSHSDNPRSFHPSPIVLPSVCATIR